MYKLALYGNKRNLLFFWGEELGVQETMRGKLQCVLLTIKMF